MEEQGKPWKTRKKWGKCSKTNRKNGKTKGKPRENQGKMKGNQGENSESEGKAGIWRKTNGKTRKMKGKAPQTGKQTKILRKKQKNHKKIRAVLNKMTQDTDYDYRLMFYTDMVMVAYLPDPVVKLVPIQDTEDSGWKICPGPVGQQVANVGGLDPDEGGIQTSRSLCDQVFWMKTFGVFEFFSGQPACLFVKR